LEPVRGGLDGVQQLVSLDVIEFDVSLAQAGDCSFDAGERGAQVVADRGEQSGVHPVCGLELGVGLCLLGQAAALQCGGGCFGEGGENPLVLGEQWGAEGGQR